MVLTLPRVWLALVMGICARAEAGMGLADVVRSGRAVLAKGEATGLAGALGGGGTAGNPGATRVEFRLSTSRRAEISPYIYGYNAIGQEWAKPLHNLTFARMGGNATSAYNWENNLNHAGSDWSYANVDYFCSQKEPSCHSPGEAVRRFLEKAIGAGASALVTIPLLGFVAAKDSRDDDGDADVCPPGKRTPTWECLDADGGPGYEKRAYLKTYFDRSLARKGAPFSLSPDLSDGKVHQDEFVHWIRESFKNRPAASRIFFSLDNEPELWGQTHNRIRPAGEHCRHDVTYGEILRLNLEYAAAVKAVMPETLVFGPVNYGWLGMRTLQDMGGCDGNGDRDFYDFYLSELKKDGRSLVDVLDFHWYSEARPEVCGTDYRSGKTGRCSKVRDLDKIDEIPSLTSKDAPVTRVWQEARVQAPRSLWDPGFSELSWITWRHLREPIALLPRLRRKIEKFNPGMKMAITEYNYGGERDISGAVAQADVLGILAREGVFAASYWPLDEESPFIWAAFRMYRNYDGARGSFGDLAIPARSDNVTVASVYGSLHSNDSGRLTLVALNRSFHDVVATVKIEDKAGFRKGRHWRLTGDSPEPRLAGHVAVKGNVTEIRMPPLSISTLVLER